jgi:hypothetical protein
MGYVWPKDTRYYCRGCAAIRVHEDAGSGVACSVCGRVTPTAEVLVTWAEDTVYRRPTIQPPLSMLSPAEYARKFYGQPDPGTEEV